jgi:PTS system N-acetylglucosamine-specific IIC component
MAAIAKELSKPKRKTRKAKSETEINEQLMLALPAEELAETLKYIEFLGGKENILEIDFMPPRIKIKAADVSLIDEISLRKIGAKGVLKSKGSDIVQLITTYDDCQILADKIRIVANVKRPKPQLEFSFCSQY